MKKFLLLALVLLMSLSLFSCTKKIEYNEAKDIAHKYMEALRSADGDVLLKQLSLKIKSKLKKKLFKDL